MVIQDQMLGEAYQPGTVAPTGLPYAYSNITKYYYDEALANYYFQAATFGGTPLTDTGFTLRICYNTGAGVRPALADQLASAINKVGDVIYAPNPNKFHASALGLSWGEYIPAIDAHKLPTFVMGWLPDYLDVHNYMYPYMHTGGAFAEAQQYSNPAIDALLDQAIYMADGEATRGVSYYQAEVMFQQDVPTLPLYIGIGRGYMRDWVHGHYYNPLYPGIYAANKWKWPVTTMPGSDGYFVGDLNYDGRVTMDDIIAVVAAFGSYAGKQGMPVFHSRWNYHCDVDLTQGFTSLGSRDRKVDMGDIVTTVSTFGKTSLMWRPPP
jgi:ABC-type transport system substrate-binding protein